MENIEDQHVMQMDTGGEEIVTSTPFVFSRPCIVTTSSTVTLAADSKHAFSLYGGTKNTFTFAVPVSVPRPLHHHADTLQSSSYFEGQYKPKISRNTFKPSSTMFSQAIRSTAAFEQLKKNARSQSIKTNIEHSVTCTNVPNDLLTKLAAKEHFAKYGQILKIAIRPKKHIITVYYATKEEANIAYHGSGEYMEEKFNVEWTKPEVLLKSPTKKKESHKNFVTNLLKASDDEIKSELEALKNLDYNLHTESKISNIPNSMSLIAKKGRSTYSKSTLKNEKPVLRSEKVIGKMETADMDSQILTPLSSASVEDLQTIIRQAAFTSEDKYKVLEARDRLMRLKQVKSHSLATAKVATGTCPDMCPEKERLMRESQRQVAPYELEGSEYKINHVTAIKQYSRSSADQEEPMPHELRPVKSLKMTMSYLLHEITELCEQDGTNLAEWYHFLWDRTRGIRKDITQQELCCIDSVLLVEQCARFHIVCSERLCAEELSVFDKKINSENLTKCLQSLKYMYHDLREKGIACQNESEFRAYIILLNLHNGNFMWELQRLPLFIQKSPEVEFAIEIYSALESNNYYKFFKLVRKTTYLNSCILLRYFSQVRAKALSIMVKAYCRTMSTPYPLYELIDILGFEDESEAIFFCEKVGLRLSNDELHILLNRQNFTLPMSNIEQSRAYNMVVSKRVALGLSIGQCIAGGTLPEQHYKNHRPHNSFNTQGYLKPLSINAQDQNINNEKDPYEFVEEEITKSTYSESSLGDQKDNTLKGQTTSVCEALPVYKQNTVTSSKHTSIFNKGQNDLPFQSKRSADGILDYNHSKTVPAKDASHYFDSKTSPFNAIHNDTIQSKQKGDFVFAKVSKNDDVFSTSAPKLLHTSSNFEKTSFAKTANQSIFSGSSSRNIFIKPFTSSTIFSNSTFKGESVSIQRTSTKDDKQHTQIEGNQHQTLVDKNHALLIEKQNMLKAEQIRAEELEHSKKMLCIQKNAEEILQNLQTEVLEDYCSTLVKEEINRIIMYDRLSEQILNDMMDDVSYNMCETVLKEEVNEQKIHEMTERIKSRITLKCFKAWKQYTLKKRQQREALEDTPVWLQKYSVETCAKLLYYKEQELVIQNMCKQKIEKEINRAQTQSHLAPIEVIIYIGIKENLKTLDIDAIPISFWKLVISWPDLQNKTVLWYHKKIMNQYLCASNFTTEPIIKSYQPNSYETLHVSIRHFEGFISEHNLIGSDALLFIAAASEELNVVVRRLTKTVLSRNKLVPIPLVFVILGEGNLESHSNQILSELETLLESGYLSEYTISIDKNLTEDIILNLMQSAALWLTVNKSPANPLEMDFLYQICDTCLTEELWLRILADCTYNTKLSYAMRDPNSVIDLHNEAVMHLIDIILDQESLMYTDFAPEFKKFLRHHYTLPTSCEYFGSTWKTDEYRANLENTMNSLILPHWNLPWPILDVETFRQSIAHYCQNVLPDSNIDTIVCDILSKIFLTSGTIEATDFVDVLLYMVKEKINFVSTDLKVVYNKNHIKHFCTLPWWFKSSILTKLSLQEKKHTATITHTEPVTKRQKISQHKENNNYVGQMENSDPLVKFCKQVNTKVMEVHSAVRELENRLHTQQLRNQLLEDKLKEALRSELDILC